MKCASNTLNNTKCLIRSATPDAYRGAYILWLVYLRFWEDVCWKSFSVNYSDWQNTNRN